MSTLVIGVDPGTYRMGVGVIRVVGKRMEYVRAELLEAKRGWPLARRLVELHNDLVELLDQWSTVDFAGGEVNQLAAIEEGFRGGQGDASLAEARGIARCALARIVNMDVRGYAPATVKKAVTGSGRADKVQVMRMVTARLKLKVAPGPDVADALAVAITRAMEVTR
jgi:crossover junction endodeoxyribonuclease RuvC